EADERRNLSVTEKSELRHLADPACWEPRKVTRRDQERILIRAYIGGGGEMGYGPPRPLTLDQRIEQSHWAEFRPVHRELLIDPGGTHGPTTTGWCGPVSRRTRRSRSSGRCSLRAGRGR